MCKNEIELTILSNLQLQLKFGANQTVNEVSNGHFSKTADETLIICTLYFLLVRLLDLVQQP